MSSHHAKGLRLRIKIDSTSFPFSLTSGPMVLPAPALRRGIPKRTNRVLTAFSMPLARKFLKDFANRGIQIVPCSSIHELIDSLIGEHGAIEDYDAFFLEWRLPDGHPASLLRFLRFPYPSVYIFAEKASLAQCRAELADLALGGILPLPENLPELFRLLTACRIHPTLPAQD